ncbi:MAG: 2-oxoacid:acceptor oxidoreductase family protein [Bacillota bacterium]|jgi:2-oxoglutarate ferredoxin oxidoreductase subunit gamma
MVKLREFKTILLAGFGGQGVLSMGQFLASAGMVEENEVSWIPSYGPEMRGGTANCLVTISQEEIDSPVFEFPDAAIIMNRPSLERFEKQVRAGGVLIVNASLVDLAPQRKDVQAFLVPANELSSQLGNSKVANMVMLGALIEVTKVVKIDSVIECLKSVLPDAKHHLLPLNRNALEVGAEYVRYQANEQVAV